jgi:putative SOS response-associated peptidase YedK
MCGRFILKTPFSELVRLYNLTNSVNLAPRYNVAPTQDVAVVRSSAEQGRTLAMVRWGLVPWWAKDLKMGASMINAQGETIATKPAFREAFQSRRCIVPADGFYEWKKLDAKRRQPYAIMPRDGGLFSFAGLWERWRDRASGETVQSCTIVTTQPNELCAPIHNRMPAILPQGAWGQWLGEKPASSNELLALLSSYPAEAMTAFAIGPRVGKVNNEGPELIEPAA